MPEQADFYSVSEVKALLHRHGLAPQKARGQHFLLDKKVLRTVAEAAELTAKDTVLEVGPGFGLLTKELLPRAGRVAAVEIDAELAALLRRELPDSKLEVVVDDIRGFDFRALGRSFKVVANIPYYLTSYLLRLLYSLKQPPQIAVLTIQKEVAERAAASPGQMSLLSFGVQRLAVPQIIRFIPKESFWPQPEVASAVLKLTLRPHPLVRGDEKKIFRLAKAAFSQKRRQVVNTLSAGLQLPKETVLERLQRAGIDPTRRAETLTFPEWQALYDISAEYL